MQSQELKSAKQIKQNNVIIKRALISVANKDGLIDFATTLMNLGVEIISTGGTFDHLVAHGIKTINVSNVTQFPEMLHGRVKTLHPNIHGAILAKRNEDHLSQLAMHNIVPIDLVCVNLYPFERTILKEDCTLQEAIENIDIGGPTMIRAAAKNYQSVAVITNTQSYAQVIAMLKANNCSLTMQLRFELAKIAFSHTAYYDSLISRYFTQQVFMQNTATKQIKEFSGDNHNDDNSSKNNGSQQDFSNELTIPLKLHSRLRYGENHHQHAALYVDGGVNNAGLLASFRQLQGKELSFNNLVDADAAFECVKQFTKPACVIVKHANPCAVATTNSLLASYQKAFNADKVSSFGGIVAFNGIVDCDIAKELLRQFVEVVIAYDYSKEALSLFASKPNIRVLMIASPNQNANHTSNAKVGAYDSPNNHSSLLDYKRIGGGLLVQSQERRQLYKSSDLTITTKAKASDHILADLLFAWQVARFVKSNAIVLAKDGVTLGIGAGQMSRIDSTKIAIDKARGFGFHLEGAVCASDAFFPFRDNVDLLAQAAIKAIIQPGGSIRDHEVIEAANEHEMIMAFTSYRIFRH